MNKTDGLNHYLSKKKQKGNFNKKSRSVCHKNQRSRTLRRNADRHSHHRRRKIIKEDIVYTGGENIPRSMTTVQHHNSKNSGCMDRGGARYQISNYKMCKTKWDDFL
jgi:hypothetical protein